MGSPTTGASPGSLDFELADPDAHTELVHDWLHRPHVAPWWPPALSLPETRAYLREQQARAHLDPWVVSSAGVPFAYVETYRAAEDPLATVFPLHSSDRGWHVLVGPQELLGSGLPRLLGRAVLARLFAGASIDRVVCEPDERNTRMLRFCEALGYERLATVDLPDKRAALMACTRDEFERLWPDDVAETSRGSRGHG
jgi:acetyl CoA:N6-hydroxylysine acetyl transferase